MKTIKIPVYSFNELSAKVQKKVLQDMNDINTDYQWWDFVYEDFQTLAEYFGFTVDLERSFFTLNYSQGDGSSYTAYVDPCKLIACLKGETWKKHAPKEVLSFYPVTRNIERVCKLIASGKIDFSANIEPANRETSVRVNCEWSFTSDYAHNNLENIENACNELNELIESTAKTLNKWFHRSLRNQCDYLSSDEAIIETINANEYLFFAHGGLIPRDMYPPAKVTIKKRLQTLFKSLIDRMRAKFHPVDAALIAYPCFVLIYSIVNA